MFNICSYYLKLYVNVVLMLFMYQIEQCKKKIAIETNIKYNNNKKSTKQ